MRAHRSSHRSVQRRGFTLVELLVVIGIIALLISILLPSLATARKAAQTVACASNLRSIMQATHIFASQNNGYLPGSIYSSGRFLVKDPAKGRGGANIQTGYSDTNCPNVIQLTDWASPVAKIMGVRFNEGGTTADRAARFMMMRDLPQFRCPTNEVLAPPYGALTTEVSVGRMVSYNTALPFLVQRKPSDVSDSDTNLVGVSFSRTEWNVPQSYNCKISKVGDPAKKVFIADGSKFSAGNASPQVQETYPDSDLSFAPLLGGAFADQGPSRFTRAWNRDRVPDNKGTGVDCRMFWARHTNRPIKGGKAGTYKFNIAFFDGHCETVDDLTGADPFLWYPKGTNLTVSLTQQWDDVIKRYFPKGVPAQPIVVP
jgi:prepilin-type N-terminal cleavage/methylation domain-containing protein/prepilin-type processing-associated H-X9-DG protein